jgi:hypothetical protein
MHLLASCALAALIGSASIISTASAQLLDRKDLSFARRLLSPPAHWRHQGPRLRDIRGCRRPWR